VVPGSKETSDKPWFTIYPLGTDFSYDPDAANYKGMEWIVRNLADAVEPIISRSEAHSLGEAGLAVNCSSRGG
jgi:hypothetical protein